MPKPMNFKNGMVVYVEGDMDDRIFILQSGAVDLSYPSLETGGQQHELLQKGEFFGVKSALGKHPREETANVVQDCSVIMFTVPEFEDTMMKSPRVILQMLKVYSSQLRNVNRMLSSARVESHVRRVGAGRKARLDQIEATLTVETKPEVSLFQMGEYYIAKKKIIEARYVFNKYVQNYPAGIYAGKAKERLKALGGAP